MYTHCLSLLIDDIPTKFLLGVIQTNSSTAASSMMDISETESDEEDESFATSNEYKYKQGNNSGGGGGGAPHLRPSKNLPMIRTVLVRGCCVAST